MLKDPPLLRGNRAFMLVEAALKRCQEPEHFTFPTPMTLRANHDPKTARPCGLYGVGGDSRRRKNVDRSRQLHTRRLCQSLESSVSRNPSSCLASWLAYVSLQYGCTCVSEASLGG